MVKERYVKPVIKVRLFAARPVLHTTSIQMSSTDYDAETMSISAKVSSPFIDEDVFANDLGLNDEWNWH